MQIFERDLQRITINKDKRILSLIQYNENLLKEFENKINKNLDPTQLFLTHAFKTIVSNEIADKIIDFFKTSCL